MSSSAVMERKTPRRQADELGVLLSDTYILYTKNQNFHWNVVDPRFHSLHEFFEEQYKALAEGIDVIAEQIRSCGFKAPGSLKQFLELTRLEEAGQNLSGDEMLKSLLKDHEKIIQWLRPAIDAFTKEDDQGTADMCIERLRFHEKAVWMIKSHFTK